MTKADAILLGEGMLTWMRHERVSDRYGAVYLRDPFPDGWTALQKYSAGGPTPGVRECIAPEIPDGLEGRLGRLVAVVTVNRQSDHIGDLFRGIYPPRPPVAVGTRVTLGRGRLFTETEHDDVTITTVGLRPDDGRGSDWLDPRKLYRVHEQTVRLTFHLTKEAA